METNRRFVWSSPSRMFSLWLQVASRLERSYLRWVTSSFRPILYLTVELLWWLLTNSYIFPITGSYRLGDGSAVWFCGGPLGWLPGRPSCSSHCSTRLGFLSSGLMAEEYNSIASYVLFYIEVCVWYCVGSILCYRLLWTCDQPDAYTSTWHTILTIDMPSAGFESATPSSERPQTHALDRAATGTGRLSLLGVGEEQQK
jgi:hypothetical protein